MDGFHSVSAIDAIYDDAARLRRIADTYDTPTHILSLDRVSRNYAAACQAWAFTRLRMKVLYSIKTNYMPVVIASLKNDGAGVDVVSGIELKLALDLGFEPASIVFNGPFKTDEELRAAVSLGILINVDCVGEAKRIGTLAKECGLTANVGLRVNPGVSPYLSNDPSYNVRSSNNARESKFGLSVQDGEADAAVSQIVALDGIQLVGVHCHLGSQMNDLASYLQGIAVTLSFLQRARSVCPMTIANIGGGFGVPGLRRDRSGPLTQFGDPTSIGIGKQNTDFFSINAFAQAMSELVRQMDLQDVQFHCEPGRLIVSDAMCLLTRVRSLKRSAGLNWVIVDAGLHLMPTVAMGEEREIVAVTPTATPAESFRIAGPLCYEGDILSRYQRLPASLSEGDLLMIKDTGAYTISRSTNFIRPRAAVVLATGESERLVWRRETFDDVFSFDIGSPGMSGRSAEFSQNIDRGSGINHK